MYKDLRVCLVLLLAALVADGKQFRFDYKYYPEAEGWFKLHLMPTNWTDARLHCDLEGAVLASPFNTKLQNAMKDVMANQVHCGVFTGIHATISKGDYFSIEGVPLSKIPVAWAPNEPDNFENSEDCLMMLTNGTMADVKCTDAFPYVCYKKAVNFVVGRCGTADSEYHLEYKTGSCYKFHRVGKTWSRSYMTCAAEGAYLTIINSEVESQVLKELYSKYPDNLIQSQFPGAVFIGVYDWNDHNTWRTVHGETLQAAGYEKWSKGEPNNHRNDEFCVVINRLGFLNDVSCNASLPFICEKSTTSINNDTKDRY